MKCLGVKNPPNNNICSRWNELRVRIPVEFSGEFCKIKLVIPLCTKKYVGKLG